MLEDMQDPSILLPLRDPNEHWRSIFNKYDKNKNGLICVKELDELINSQEYENDIPDHVVAKIHSLADLNNDGQLDFEEFVAMIKHPALEPLFGSMVNRYVQMFVPINTAQYPNRSKGKYADECKCCPPPICMIVISMVEIIFYCIDAAEGPTEAGMGPIAVAFVYDPRKRYEVWRYISYMFVHIGLIHLVVNLCIQVLLGTPLEMVHKWWRVLVIYFAGVLAGSLGTSITDPTVKLAGASGGVYALITAHIATIAMNWKEMEYPAVQLLIFLIITGCDLGTAIHNRYVLKLEETTGYAAHLAGAIAGLLVGINVVRNIKVTRTERIVWWISTVTYVILMATAILWNVAFPGYFLPPN